MKRLSVLLPALLLIVALFSQIGRDLMFGWIGFLRRVVPQLSINWTLVAVGVTTWIASVLLIDHLCRWFRKASSTDVPSWRFRSSLCIGSLIVVMFCAGIAATGLTHQAAWLRRTPIWVSKIQTWLGSEDQAVRNCLISVFFAVQEYSYQRELPFGEIETQGRPPQSWAATSIAHYNSYNEHDYDLKLPWDHKSNREYNSVVIPELLNPTLENVVQHDSRGYGLSHFAANKQAASITKTEITAGSSHIALVGEVRSNFQPWAKPHTHRDMTLGLNSHENGFGGPNSRDTVLFLVADGSVRFVSDTIDPEVLRQLSDPEHARGGGSEPPGVRFGDMIPAIYRTDEPELPVSEPPNADVPQTEQPNSGD